MKKIFALLISLAMIFTLVACSSSVEQNLNKQEENFAVEEQIDENLTTESIVGKKSMTDEFIEKFNAISPIQITDAVEIDVTDQDSGHYRTEFRLGAFENSISKTGKFGDFVIDVVNCGWQNDELRIYVDGITGEQAVEIVKYAAPIMDPDVSDEELQDVMNYLNGTKDYHNGYFGNLCLTFNDIRGELMLRTD